MLRIDASLTSSGETTVVLTGQIESHYLDVLRHLIARVRSDNRSIRFDLRNVGLVDRDAVAFFVSGPGRNVPLDHCPRYLSEWLKSEGRELHDAS
jgi:hypothetical protein